jgi:hypothetical protein
VVWKEIPLVAAEVHHVHQPLAQAHHLLQLYPYIPSNVMWSIVEPTCWASWYNSRVVSYYQDRTNC